MSKRIVTVDVLWCPNSGGGKRKPRVSSGPARQTGWSFPPAVAKHLIKEFQGKRILQLFGGHSSFGTRLDVDPLTKPDVIGDAWLPPFSKDSFDIVIMDPPYVHFNAAAKTALFRAAAWIAKDYVVWFHPVWQASSGGVRLERAWLVRVGDSCVVRALQFFKVVRKDGPVHNFKRGPAMKYNRWLRQPGGLVLHPGEDF